MNTNTNESENERHPGAVLRQMIEVRAYHIWLENGGGHGGHEQHWLQAERELMEATKHDSKGQSNARPRKKTPSRFRPRV